MRLFLSVSMSSIAYRAYGNWVTVRVTVVLQAKLLSSGRCVGLKKAAYNRSDPIDKKLADANLVYYLV